MGPIEEEGTRIIRITQLGIEKMMLGVTPFTQLIKGRQRDSELRRRSKIAIASIKSSKIRSARNVIMSRTCLLRT